MSSHQIGTIHGDQQEKVIQERSRPDLDKPCASVTPLEGADCSNLHDASMDTEPVWVKRDDGNVSSQSKELISTNTEPELPEGDDHSKRDGTDGTDDGNENESDIEVF